MYEHLVVAVDGSQTSLNALNHAVKWALQGKSRLTLVNVANPNEYMTIAPEFLNYDSYEAAATEQGKAVVEKAAQLARDAGVVEVDTHLILSVAGVKEMARELIDFADDQKADLMVLGTHGRTGLMHLLMGSFTETVIRQSHLPLLIIRSNDGNED